MDLKGAEIRSYKEMGQVINDSNKLTYPLKVPHYQRPYKWTDENIQKLINDWYEHDQKSDYFCGSIVTVVHHDQPHDLIDGQQRFTTLFLANYINFLVLKSLVCASLKYKSYAMWFMTFYDEMIEALQFLIDMKSGSFNELSKDNLEDLKREVLNKIDENKDDDAIEAFNRLFSNESIRTKILNQKLMLQYDRSSFNKSLVKVLSNIDIKLNNEEDIHFSSDLKYDSEQYNDNENIYTLAVNSIFKNFREKVRLTKVSPSKINSVQVAIKLKESISNFINEVKVCIIQTGNPDDAYTLFEVLNDRALALDDLDLIKNEFYKTYVLKGEESLSDTQKDKMLQALDNKWVDKIFKDTQEYEKKLITFLAVTFLTGSESIKYDNSKGYRDALKIYFNQYSKDNPYTNTSIDRDFNIFQACKAFITKFNLKYQKKDLTALQMEYSYEKSSSLKTVHFLYAKDQLSVLSGFTNFILKNIESVNNSFENQEVEKILDKIMNGDYEFAEKNIKNICMDCDSQAKSLWQVAMKSKDYKKPRAFAIELISRNYLSSGAPQMQGINIDLNEELDAEFEKWLREWKYSTNSRATLPIRILFAKLIKSNLDKVTNELIATTVSNTISQNDVSKMQLDHIEPQNIVAEAEIKYFKHINRDRYVNELGNMMPLPDAQNKDKSNKPVLDSFIFFEEAGLDKHFILEETKKLFDENKSPSEGLPNYFVPNEDFFDKRKEVLIIWFKQVANQKFL